MMKSLPLFHQVTGQTILVMGNGEAAEAKRRLVKRAGGVVTGDVDAARQAGCRIAFVALDQREECESVAGELRAAGMLVNVPDQPDLCDFTIPSILDRDPVLIAIGTGGASAGLAKHIRMGTRFIKFRLFVRFFRPNPVNARDCHYHLARLLSSRIFMQFNCQNQHTIIIHAPGTHLNLSKEEITDPYNDEKQKPCHISLLSSRTSFPRISVIKRDVHKILVI